MSQKEIKQVHDKEATFSAPTERNGIPPPQSVSNFISLDINKVVLPSHVSLLLLTFCSKSLQFRYFPPFRANTFNFAYTEHSSRISFPI